MAGSLKNKIVASDLLEERSKCAFDKQELELLVKGGPALKKDFDYFESLFVKHPEMAKNHKFYEMTTDEKQRDLWRRLNFMAKHYPELFKAKSYPEGTGELIFNLF